MEKDAAPLLLTHCSGGLDHRTFRQRAIAGRNPMLLFELERALFKFSAASPALEALFQLPPQIGNR
jgi:hypothetical protein